TKMRIKLGKLKRFDLVLCVQNWVMSITVTTPQKLLEQARRFGILVFCFFSLCAGVAMASEADAIAISQNIRARHMPFGVIVDPVFASPDSEQIISYTRCGDSAIWTGHYLAAEAFRYNVTQSAVALDNVKAALSGLSSLLNVTGT